MGDHKFQVAVVVDVGDPCGRDGVSDPGGHEAHECHVVEGSDLDELTIGPDEVVDAVAIPIRDVAEGAVGDDRSEWGRDGGGAAWCWGRFLEGDPFAMDRGDTEGRDGAVASGGDGGLPVHAERGCGPCGRE